MELLEAAMVERDRWQRRSDELVSMRRGLGDEESRLLAELARVDEQIAYYDALAREMKREMLPPRLGRLMRALWRG